ncbi:MAG: LysR family transcriptional regulator [Spirochaetaceae bacterium]|jgi:lysyl-tRNA synthetase class 2|nr:LysR family transcriptional regulator [Spirochaetaceae bacterium]
MDIERLRQRAGIIQKVRTFFIRRGYLETDTPALSPDLIPETCLEVFQTTLLDGHTGEGSPLYLVPSPEIYLKRLIAHHRVSLFQVSKCYRNYESVGRFHNPEFTMLEYYTMGATYRESAQVTEDLFRFLGTPDPGRESPASLPPDLCPPFLHLTVDNAFLGFAGFRLSEAPESADLAAQARRLGITESAGHPFDAWPWDDLYELILVHAVESALPRDRPILLTDYPAAVPCLAKDVTPVDGGKPRWKERWELYCRGVELANCYSEETDPIKVRNYFRREGEAKQASARVPHRIDGGYWRIFQDFPACSGVALGVDRLVALLCGAESIAPVIPHPL